MNTDKKTYRIIVTKINEHFLHCNVDRKYRFCGISFWLPVQGGGGPATYHSVEEAKEYIFHANNPPKISHEIIS